MMNQDLSTVRSGDDLEWYLEQARRFPMLSAEEERQLAERWKNDRDEAAARQLLGSHLRLVVKIARGSAATACHSAI
jgi:RNA polymerase sigma-32 factor